MCVRLAHSRTGYKRSLIYNFLNKYRLPDSGRARKAKFQLHLFVPFPSAVPPPTKQGLPLSVHSTCTVKAKSILCGNCRFGDYLCPPILPANNDFSPAQCAWTLMNNPQWPFSRATRTIYIFLKREFIMTKGRKTVISYCGSLFST